MKQNHMNVDELVQQIKQAANQQTDNRYFVYGHISSYDDTLHRVRVTMPSLRYDNGDGIVIPVSPWMPLASLWVGAGFGLQIAPSGGEQCIVNLISGQQGTQVCAELLYTSVMMPPGGVAAGEALLKHQSGSFLKFHANGDIETNTQGNAIITSAQNVNVTGTQNVNVTAESVVNVTAPQINLGDGGTLVDALTSAAATLFNSHTHGGIQAGGSHTAVPDQTMSTGQMTSIVKVS